MTCTNHHICECLQTLSDERALTIGQLSKQVSEQQVLIEVLQQKKLNLFEAALALSVPEITHEQARLFDEIVTASPSPKTRKEYLITLLLMCRELYQRGLAQVPAGKENPFTKDVPLYQKFIRLLRLALEGEYGL